MQRATRHIDLRQARLPIHRRCNGLRLGRMRCRLRAFLLEQVGAALYRTHTLPCPALPCPALPATRSCWGNACGAGSDANRSSSAKAEHRTAQRRHAPPPTDRRTHPPLAGVSTSAERPARTAPFRSFAALHAPVQLEHLLGLLRRRLRRAHAHDRCACCGRRAPVRRDVRGGRVRASAVPRRLRADGVECVGAVLRPLQRCRSPRARRLRAPTDSRACAHTRTICGACAACLRSRVAPWSRSVCRRSGRDDASAHGHGGAHVRRAALRQVMAWVRVRVWVWVSVLRQAIAREGAALFAGRSRRGLFHLSAA